MGDYKMVYSGVGTKDREFEFNELPNDLKRIIKRKEKYYNRSCRHVWSFTNSLGERYIFGSFVVNYTDKLIITLMYHCNTLRQMRISY